MKKISVVHILLAVMALLILIPYGLIAYGMIWGFPETPAPVYLNKDVGEESFSMPLAVDEIWDEDDFTLLLSDVKVGKVNENGMRLCEITVQIENKNLITHKNSRKLMGFVHHNRDSEHAYRGSMGTVEEWERENTTKPEKHVKDLMQIWIGTSAWVSEHVDQGLPRSELAEWYIPKGEKAVYQYQVWIPENPLAIDITFQMLTDRKKNEQYWKEYRFNPADYLNEVTE